MAKFYYKVKGTASETFSVGAIEADTKQTAKSSLDAIYGEGVELAIIDKKEFDAIEEANGDHLTHKAEV